MSTVSAEEAGWLPRDGKQAAKTAQQLCFDSAKPSPAEWFPGGRAEREEGWELDVGRAGPFPLCLPASPSRPLALEAEWRRAALSKYNLSLAPRVDPVAPEEPWSRTETPGKETGIWHCAFQKFSTPFLLLF